MRARIVIAIVVVVVVALAAGVLMMLTTSKSAPPPMMQAPPAREAAKDARPPAPPPPPPSEPSGIEADGAPGGGSPPGAKRNAAPAPPFIERHGVRRVGCDFACGREAECGLRDVDACVAASCDDEVRVPMTMDYCFVRADDCGAAVDCSCAEACWKKNECVGDHSHDAECARACDVLVKQKPKDVYKENRCILEHRCGPEIAACSVNNTY